MQHAPSREGKAWNSPSKPIWLERTMLQCLQFLFGHIPGPLSSLKARASLELFQDPEIDRAVADPCVNKRTTHLYWNM